MTVYVIIGLFAGSGFGGRKEKLLSNDLLCLSSLRQLQEH